ncbi:uncharacterized protein [Periplaneta americana]|uniref:uncharacterized protein n=1 Tax=Periplaneta americana TaxID=6978 RepID=UPI0037E8B8F6
MRFLALVIALAGAAGAVSVSEDEDSRAEATGFDGFGGFGGFKAFHQFHGLMSNAFGDLEGQFDSSGFDKKFDAGYAQNFLDGIDHNNFGSEAGSSPSTQGRLVPAPQNTRLSVPRHQPQPIRAPPHSHLTKAVVKTPYAVREQGLSAYSRSRLPPPRTAQSVSRYPTVTVAARKSSSGGSRDYTREKNQGFDFGNY